MPINKKNNSPSGAKQSNGTGVRAKAPRPNQHVDIPLTKNTPAELHLKETVFKLHRTDKSEQPCSIKRTGVGHASLPQPSKYHNDRIGQKLLAHKAMMSANHKSVNGEQVPPMNAKEAALHANDNNPFLRGLGLQNPTGSRKEIVFEFVDFLDIEVSETTPLCQYQLDPNVTNVLDPWGNSPGVNLGRVKSVSVWALPQFNVDVADASVEIIFGCPVRATGDYRLDNTGFEQGSGYTKEVELIQDEYQGTGAQQATVLTPTSVSDWVCVGRWSSGSLFSDSNFEPCYGSSENNAGKNGQALFTISVVSPDTGDATDKKIQLMVEVELAQTVPTLGKILVAFPNTSGAEAWVQAAPATLTEQPAIIKLKGIENSM